MENRIKSSSPRIYKKYFKFIEPSNIVVGKKITDTFLKTNYRV